MCKLAINLGSSELTSVHVPYRNTRIFWNRHTIYAIYSNTRFTRENEAISVASEISITVTRPLLDGLQKITRKGVKWSWHSGKKELEQGIKHLVLTLQVSSVALESMFSFRNLRCDDRRNRLLPTNLEKTVKMRFLNELFTVDTQYRIRSFFVHDADALWESIRKTRYMVFSTRVNSLLGRNCSFQ